MPENLKVQLEQKRLPFHNKAPYGRPRMYDEPHSIASVKAADDTTDPPDTYM